MEEETVSLIIEDEQILVDKQTLVNHSQYFCAMFSSGMRESTQNSVVLHDITVDVIRKLLNFFQTGQLTFDQSGTQEILTTAIFLQMDDVINHAKMSVTVENAAEMFEVADLHFLPDLEKATLRHLSINYLELLQSDTFEKLTEEQQEAIRSLRFGGKDTICTIGSYDKDVHLTQDAPRTTHLLDDQAGEWTPYCDVPSSFSTNACGVASLHNYLFLTGGFTSFKSDQMQKSSICFDVLTHKWTPFAAMTDSRANFAFIGLGSTLYAIGGNQLCRSSGSNTKALASVEAYDLRKGSWKRLEPLPTDMIKPCVAVCMGKIYITLSFDNGEKLYSLLQCTGQWRRVSTVRKSRFVFSMSSVDETLYLIGGRPGDFSCYNVTTGQWSTLFKSYSEQYLDDCTALGDTVFMVSSNATQCYNVKSRLWDCYSIPGSPTNGYMRTRVINISPRTYYQ